MTAHEIRTWNTSSSQAPRPHQLLFLHTELLSDVYDAFFQICIRCHSSIKLCTAFPGWMRWNKARALAYLTRVHPLLFDHHWFFMTSARLTLPAARCPTHSSQLMPNLPNNSIKRCWPMYSVLVVFLVCIAKKRQWTF